MEPFLRKKWSGSWANFSSSMPGFQLLAELEEHAVAIAERLIEYILGMG